MLKNFLHQLASNAFVYDLIQKAAGQRQFHRFIGPVLQELQNKTVLDLGAGTGTLRQLIPATNQYIWLDIDREKLKGFQPAALPATAILGDATRIALKDKSVDVTTCIALSHHLSDEQLLNFAHELSRVTSQKIIFMDAVRSERWIGKLLWKYDQGAYPREKRTLLEILGQEFQIQRVDKLTVYHEYFLCIASPRQ